MKILMVSAPKHIAGPIPSITDLLVSGLEDNDCSVTLLSMWGQRKPNENLVTKVYQRVLDVISIVRQACTEKYDFIYINASHDELLREITLLLGLRIQSAPVVALFHGSRSEKLLSRNTFFVVATEMYLHLVDGLLLLSTEEFTAFKRLWPWAPCGVVPNPVGPSPFDWRQKIASYKEGQQLKLAFIGRFIEQKGVLDVIEAFKQVADRVNCKLLLVGDGPLLAEMQRRIAAYGLQNRVEFTGYLDRQHIWDLYKIADILLLPTYFAEGMPTVVLEAMASGLGIVCTCIRGVADYLQEGKNALFVPPRSPDAIVQQVMTLATNAGKLDEMRIANQELAQRFAPVVVAHKQLEVIRSLVKRIR